MSTLLSIIIPVYNAEATITRLLDSIYALKEREEEYEIIAVDDCSTDRSVQVLHEYASSHPNLKILEHKENQGGPAAGRNDGLKAARGNYVWFVDCDDMIIAEDVPKLWGEFESESLDILCFNFSHYANGRISQGSEFNETRVMTGREMHCKHPAFLAPWNKIIRRQFLIKNNIEFTVHLFPEDQGWCDICFLHADRAKIFPYQLYLWCQRPDSTSRGNSHVFKYLSGYPEVIQSHLTIMDRYPAPRFWAHVHSMLFRYWTQWLLNGYNRGLLTESNFSEAFALEKKLAIQILSKIPFQRTKDYMLILSMKIAPAMYTKAIFHISRRRKKHTSGLSKG